MYIWKKIVKLKQSGLGYKAIANQLGVSKNTVKKYLRMKTPPSYKQRPPEKSKWEEFQDEIIKGITKDLKPAVIFENLKTKGAKGGHSSFYEYFNKLSKKFKPQKLSMRYETEPGEQAQFDWAEYLIEYKKTGRKKVYIITMILGNSRYRLNVASEDVTQISLFESMELAFAYFGGVPKSLLIDNPKQLITNAKRDNFKINQKFLEFSVYYNFKIKPCKVRRPETKGKVENPFKYLENHFIKNNEFEDFEDLSKKLKEFTEKVNQREHKGLGGIPEEYFKKIEHGRLQELPKHSYFEEMNQEIRQVNHTGTIRYKEVTYSVPILYAYKSVRIKPFLGHKLYIYGESGEQIAEHKIKHTKGGIVVKDEHYEPFLKKEKQDYSKVKEEFKEIFPKTEYFLEGLKNQRRTHYLSDISKILRLKDYYSQEEIKKSFQICKKYSEYSYDLVYGYLQNNCKAKQIDYQVIGKAVKLEEKYIKTISRKLNYYDKIKN